MTQPLSRWLQLAGALFLLAGVPAHAQVTMVTDGSSSSSQCNTFNVMAGGSIVLAPNGCLGLSQPVSGTRPVNISTRMQVLTGDNVLIGGLTIGGTVPKTVVVRARGPSLAADGIANPLANPSLQLFSGQTPLASNDDWGTVANAAAITASGFAPSHPAESAIHTTLSPGAYTAIMTGVGGTGVGLIEVFEVDHPDSPLSNLSARGQVGTGNDVMIGGFVIQGSQPQTVVVRARGPSLTASGVVGALANPSLRLLSGATEIAANDDWGLAANAAAIISSGFAPSNPNESVILMTLNPGAYTAIVSGFGGTTGVAIVEIFALP